MKTKHGIYALLILVLALEVWALITGHQTISQVVWVASFTYPIIPFLAGVVCGHLFWPSTTKLEALGLHRWKRQDKVIENLGDPSKASDPLLRVHANTLFRIHTTGG